jgi:hypothetical protein
MPSQYRKRNRSKKLYKNKTQVERQNSRRNKLPGKAVSARGQKGGADTLENNVNTYNEILDIFKQCDHELNDTIIEHYTKIDKIAKFIQQNLKNDTQENKDYEDIFYNELYTRLEPYVKSGD